MNELDKNFKKFWNFSIGFYAIWIAHLGRKMKLFEEIAKGPINIQTLIKRTGLHAPAVHAWCSSAYAFEIINKIGNKVCLSKTNLEILMDTNSKYYLGGQFSYLAERSLDFYAFDRFFKSGSHTTMTSMVSAIEQATEWDHNHFLRDIVKNKFLHTRLKKGGNVLDLGCGSGKFIQKMKIRYPSSKYVGIDPDMESVIKASRNLLSVGEKSIDIIQMSAENIRFLNQFDLIFLGESLYAFNNKDMVILRCHQALKHNGTIAIIEGLMPDSRQRHQKVSRNNLLVYAMQLDFGLQGFNFMTKSEIYNLLKSNRFSDIRYKDLGGAVFLITAKKVVVKHASGT